MGTFSKFVFRHVNLHLPRSAYILCPAHRGNLPVLLIASLDLSKIAKCSMVNFHIWFIAALISYYGWVVTLLWNFGKVSCFTSQIPFQYFLFLQFILLYLYSLCVIFSSVVFIILNQIVFQIYFTFPETIKEIKNYFSQ